MTVLSKQRAVASSSTQPCTFLGRQGFSLRREKLNFINYVKYAVGASMGDAVAEAERTVVIYLVLEAKNRAGCQFLRARHAQPHIEQLRITIYESLLRR